MLYPASTNIAENLVNVDKWTVTGSTMSFSVSSGFLNVNAPIPIHSKTSERAALIGHYLNAKKLDYRFVYKKVDDVNSELIVGLLSANVWVQLSLLLVIKNVGNTTFFSVRQQGFFNTETLLIATNATVGSEILINVNFTSYFFNLTVNGVVKSVPFSTPYNTSQFVLSPVLGNHQVKDIVISSEYSSRPDIRFFGDSITANYVSYADYVGMRFNNYVVCAGQADRTTELKLALANNNSFIPLVTVILIGTNNLSSGMSPRDFATEMEYIYNYLDAKSDVYVCELLCRNDLGVRDYNSQLYKVIPVEKIIPTFPVLKQTGNDQFVPANTVDGLHPSDVGARILGTFISSFLEARGY